MARPHKVGKGGRYYRLALWPWRQTLNHAIAMVAVVFNRLTGSKDSVVCKEESDKTE